MTGHIFVDETKNGTYLVAATLIRPTDLTATRRQIKGLLLPGQRSVHFTKENDSRRRKIITTICATGASVILYDASGFHDERKARAACLTALLQDAAEQGAQMLVIEQDDSLVPHDRRLLFDTVRKLGIEGQLRYEHKPPHEESLLWIPDAVAWCWTKKKDWRPRVDPIVQEIRVL